MKANVFDESDRGLIFEAARVTGVESAINATKLALSGVRVRVPDIHLVVEACHRRRLYEWVRKPDKRNLLLDNDGLLIRLVGAFPTRYHGMSDSVEISIDYAGDAEQGHG